jgi:hypothetical protein
MIRLWRITWLERTPPIEEVDFGFGQRVSAADLLEGHFHQLATATTEPAAQQAKARHAIIEVVAPTLTPLTDLAETVAQTIPEAHPTAHFRSTLNKALTETHRQHSAQRTLGIRSTPAEPHGWQSILIVSLILTVITFGVALYGQRLNSPVQPR